MYIYIHIKENFIRLMFIKYMETLKTSYAEFSFC